MNFNNLAQKLQPLAPVILLLFPLLFAFIPGVGGSSLEGDVNQTDNVVFKVVDQNGFPRSCAVIPNTTDPSTDQAIFTGFDGTFSLFAEPGETVSVFFSCHEKNTAPQTAEATAIAPESGKVHKKVVIANPNSSSIGS